MKALYVEGAIWDGDGNPKTGVVVVELDEDAAPLGGQLRIEVDGQSVVTVSLTHEDVDLLDDLARDVYSELLDRKRKEEPGDG